MNIASLTLDVNSGKVAAATQNLNALSQAAGRTEKASTSLLGAWGKLMGVVGAVTGAVFAAKGVSETVVQYESLEAQLKTATGSAQGAAVAFEALKQFATETPYELSQAVEAFIKLTNLGLTPSERALRSYGNTASAMGKDLTTMVQAVANATVGEFEILKQFGIKAQADGDKVRFIFRGTTTEVANTAAAIEEHMVKLGELNFAGSMEEKMKTLGGAFSNLGDAWDQMVYAISKSGPADAAKGLLSGITGELNNLTKAFESGQATKYLEAFFNKFSTGAASAREGLSLISAELNELGRTGDSVLGALVQWVFDAFRYLPENISAAAQGLGATFGYLYTLAEKVFGAIKQHVVNNYSLMVEGAKSVWDSIVNLDPSIFAGRVKQYFTDSAANLGNLRTGIDFATVAYQEQITAILNARDASMKRTEALKAEGNALRVASQQEVVQNGDSLAGFKVKPVGVGPQFAALQKELQGEVEAIRASYAARHQIIEEEKNATLETRRAMSDQLIAMEQADSRKRVESAIGDTELQLAQLQTGFDAEAQIEAIEYQKKLETYRSFLEQKRITQEEYERAVSTAQATYSKRVVDIERAGAVSRMQIQSQVLGMFGDVANQLEGMLKKGSSAQKAAFIAAKAIAIAQAIVNTELAATLAMAQGGAWLGIPLSTMIRAAGYASVGLIAAQTVMGLSQHEHGGMIPAGRSGIVGEAGPEIVRGPAMVTSARTTADMLRGSRGSSGGNVNVNVINQSGAQVDVEESEANGEKFISVVINRAKREIAQEIRNGGTDLSSSFEAAYRMRRGGLAGGAA